MHLLISYQLNDYQENLDNLGDQRQFFLQEVFCQQYVKVGMSVTQPKAVF